MQIFVVLVLRMEPEQRMKEILSPDSITILLIHVSPLIAARFLSIIAATEIHACCYFYT
jgi:hypothetical protein